MQLEGTLDQFSLSELLSMMVSSSVKGVLEIGAQASIGQIFCRDGWLYHATAGEQTGVAAIRHIVKAHTAAFCFVPGIASPAETLWRDPEVLIAFIRRQEQLHAQLRPSIPSLDWVPTLLAGIDDVPIQLSAAVWPILATIDGQRSVEDIATLLWQEPVEVGIAISELIERGLARVVPPQQATTAAGNIQTVAGEGLLERLLASSDLSSAEGLAATARSRSGGGFIERLLTAKSADESGIRHKQARLIAGRFHPLSVQWSERW